MLVKFGVLYYVLQVSRRISYTTTWLSTGSVACLLKMEYIGLLLRLISHTISTVTYMNQYFNFLPHSLHSRPRSLQNKTLPTSNPFMTTYIPTASMNISSKQDQNVTPPSFYTHADEKLCSPTRARPSSSPLTLFPTWSREDKEGKTIVSAIWAISAEKSELEAG